MADQGATGDEFRRLINIMASLRAPGGCPWDQEQTHETLKRYLVEECHEVLSAIDDGDDAKLTEELGDLLLQIVFQAQVARERGAFDIEEVCRAINDKLVRRHPHVFGELKVNGPADVLRNWETIKKEERERKGKAPSVLSGVPHSLPSLALAQAIQKKAASVGFDWDDVQGPLGKLREEVAELEDAIASDDRERIYGELGDIVFAAVNVARLLDLDADDALCRTLRKFEERFSFIEQAVAVRGEALEGVSIAEMDELWEQAKANATRQVPQDRRYHQASHGRKGRGRRGTHRD